MHASHGLTRTLDVKSTSSRLPYFDLDRKVERITALIGLRHLTLRGSLSLRLVARRKHMRKQELA